MVTVIAPVVSMYPPLGVSVSACGWICNDPDHGSFWVRDKPLMCQQWQAMLCVHTVQAPLVCSDVGWGRVGSNLRDGTSSHAYLGHVWGGGGSKHPMEGKAIA